MEVSQQTREQIQQTSFKGSNLLYEYGKGFYFTALLPDSIRNMVLWKIHHYSSVTSLKVGHYVVTSIHIYKKVKK